MVEVVRAENPLKGFRCHNGQHWNGSGFGKREGGGVLSGRVEWPREKPC
jgi:hypothetical protein